MTGKVETPSGKSARDENFPVGSWLLPPELRPHVAIFYDFARAIDDIADNPDLTPADKITRLEGFAAALERGEGDALDYAKALRLRRSLAERGITTRHGLDLIDAFKQDALQSRYQTWDELIGYCLRSACPVGRYLLDLHGESPAGYPASDALCNALQVLNHLQDCRDDHRDLDRVYLPQVWLAECGATIDDLQAPRASQGLRDVIDRALDRTDELLEQARTLPGRLTSRRLAMESTVVVKLALRLAALLRRGDPIAGRVALDKGDFLTAGLAGLGAGLLPFGGGLMRTLVSGGTGAGRR